MQYRDFISSQTLPLESLSKITTYLSVLPLALPNLIHHHHIRHFIFIFLSIAPQNISAMKAELLSAH